MSEIYIPEAVKSRNAGLGKETLIYFRRIADQHIIIPMVAHALTPRGYVKMEANSARELERISKEYEVQKQREFAMIDEARQGKIEAYHKNLRSKLHEAKKTASPAGRDMIDRILRNLEEGERRLKFRKIEGHLAIEAG